MGKAARWFRTILGKKEQQATTKDQQRRPHQQDQAPPPPPPATGKRWSFGKSSRDSAEAAAAAAAVVSAGAGNAAIARAAEAAWLRSAACAETDREREQSKHAIAVAAATAAAADAAVAAAQAAVAVVRLTSKGRAPPPGVLAAAAVRIQTAFRGFLVRIDPQELFFLSLSTVPHPVIEWNPTVLCRCPAAASTCSSIRTGRLLCSALCFVPLFVLAVSL